MSRSYKLLIQASKTKTKDELLIQSELQDFFYEVARFGVERKVVNGREYLSWEGEVSLSGGTTEEEYHQQIRESLQEQTEDYSDDLKVKTSWLYIDEYSDVIGDVV